MLFSSFNTYQFCWNLIFSKECKNTCFSLTQSQMCQICCWSISYFKKIGAWEWNNPFTQTWAVSLSRAAVGVKGLMQSHVDGDGVDFGIRSFSRKNVRMWYCRFYLFIYLFTFFLFSLAMAKPLMWDYSPIPSKQDLWFKRLGCFGKTNIELLCSYPVKFKLFARVQYINTDDDDNL